MSSSLLRSAVWTLLQGKSVNNAIGEDSETYRKITTKTSHAIGVIQLQLNFSGNYENC